MNTGTTQAWLALRWEKGNRYYRVLLQPDLWHQWVVIRSWGRKNTALGRVVLLPVASYEDGLASIEQMGRVRQRRGYTLVNVGAMENVAERTRVPS
jgi:predicted DNA-binding WGR domain protein